MYSFSYLELVCSGGLLFPSLSEWSHPTPETKGGGREDQPHVQRAVAARVQEGLEELSHIEVQEVWQ